MAKARRREETKVRPTTADPDTLLGELVLYLARQCEEDPRFGATKLNKLLWNADFAAYVEFGKSITGQEYFALEHGPAPRRLLPVLDQLKQEQAAAVRPDDHFGWTQQRTFALRAPNLRLFGGPEIALVDRVIRECWHQNATEVSEASHGFIGWKVAKRGETIPYSVALVSARKLTKTEEQRALELAQALPAE